MDIYVYIWVFTDLLLVAAAVTGDFVPSQAGHEEQ
jgi:hypothetical protein